MGMITLTRGQVAIIDDADIEWLNQWKWCAGWNRSTKSFYAKRIGPNRTTILLHRTILGLEPGDKRDGDHINCDTLDNRRENLRIATRAQNMCNSKLRASNTSGYKGVHRVANRWAAQINIEGKQIYLGLRDTPEDAHLLYVEAAKKCHGEFARTR